MKNSIEKSKKVTLTKNNVDVSNSWFLSTMKIQALLSNRHRFRFAYKVPIFPPKLAGALSNQSPCVILRMDLKTNLVT